MAPHVGSYHIEWFTAQDPSSAGREPLWENLAAHFVPVRSVMVPTENPIATAEYIDAVRHATLSGAPGDSFFARGGYADHNRTGLRTPGWEGGSKGLSLEALVRELSGFDIVMSANSLDDVATKVRVVKCM